MSSVSSPRLSPATRMGTVALTVHDLERSRSFYEQVMGLPARESDAGTLLLGPESRGPLIELFGDAAAPPLDPRRTGLFHLAVLLPSREELGFALLRLLRAGWPLSGASDHLVSEALYLADPDGNGIEIYRDRPRAEWRYRDGQLQMATLPLELDDLVRDLRHASLQTSTLVPAETKIGHVHLQVSDLRSSEDFYAGLLGFDVTVRGYPGALFVSAGGYHHHLGLNTWRSAGSPPPEPGAVGLGWYEVLVSGEQELRDTVARLQDGGAAVEWRGGGAFTRDPSGNGLLLRAG